MTIGFIHVAEFDFIDRFSHFATGKSLIIGEGAKAICQEIYRKLIDASFRVWGPLWTLQGKTVFSKMPFVNQLNSLKRILKGSNFDKSEALLELPFLAVFH